MTLKPLMQPVATAALSDRSSIMRPNDISDLPDRRVVLAGVGMALGIATAPTFAAGMEMPTAMRDVIDPDARMVTLYGDGRWLEGPAWDRRTGRLVFSDVKRNRIMALDSGPAVPWRDPSSNANGNAFDREGRLVTCEHLTRRVVRQEHDGRLTVLADRYGGKRLNSPNDLAVAPDGAIWFTDPVFGITVPEEGERAEPEQPGRFVYRIDPQGGLTVVADGFDQPNGIAFSPDARTLYVSETGSGLNTEGPREIRAFDVVDGRTLVRPRVLGRLRSGIPDGLAVDRNGRIFAATAAGAQLWAPDGRHLGTIPTPRTCGNIAFGGPDGRRLYLCATDALHAIDLKTGGW